MCRLGAASSGDKRRLRPLPMIKEDFEKFVAVANELVTAENWHYVCVLVGRAEGAGKQVLHAFSNPKHKWHLEKFKLCFTGTPNAAKGVSGVLCESMYFFYKGDWAHHFQPLCVRSPSFDKRHGWDSTCREVPVFQHPGEIAIPYKIKERIFADMWKANPGDPEKPGHGLERSAQSKRDETAGTRKSMKSGSERKPDATDLSCSAIEFPIEVAEGDCQLLEPLCHMDYAVEVWHLISREWEADGAVLWTFGDGMGACAAIQHAIPTLVFVRNDLHLAIATYMVDTHLATHLARYCYDDNACHVLQSSEEKEDAAKRRKCD